MSKPLENPSMDRNSNKISSSLNFKETELRLGLPGCHSHEKNSGFVVGVSLFGMNLNMKNLVAGAKRGFSDAIDGSETKANTHQVNNNSSAQTIKEVGNGIVPHSAKLVQEKNVTVPAAKAQVVGWPPIRSFRKNTMASNSTKNDNEGEGKPGFGCLFVKVSMDGAPYLRKVDLKTYSNYKELSQALEKMFSCFTIGQCNSHGVSVKDGLSESSLRDLLHGSEYVLTYEDKDGDWMLVGDVPWEMFIDSCRRLRIMKGSEAIGLAPRAMEKSRSQN
ncbi:PREDICTED: auxin-responsive protein IAA8-like isoform X2 [Lupinus angustifolius]|uniref:auxin-responsive protein IAA8-like isoform X2 n=1 Tax=Lupinus angustifolius TaxID=3871 RepID=UPI00092E4EFC|nr:PREDICTED: auxin-responsive protein IAA8-like isoform X2 [Lupinus angustifolius]